MPEELEPDFEVLLQQRIRQLCAPRLPEPTNEVSRIERMPGIRAVLFDLYGTLFTVGRGEAGHEDDGSAQPRAIEEALAASGFACSRQGVGRRAVDLLITSIHAEHARKRAGGIDFPEVDIRACWREVAEQLLVAGDLEGAVTERALSLLSVEHECRANPPWPMPGLRATLQRLHGAGLVLGIVSNAQFYSPLMLAAFDDETGWLSGVWDRAACAWSFILGVAKPSNRVAAAAVGSLSVRCGIAPREILCVGNDMLKDVLPAAQLGCRTALFAGDARSLQWRKDDPRCAALKPDLVITRIDELAQALDL